MKKLMVFVALILSVAGSVSAEGLKLDNTTVYCGVWSKYVLGNNVVAAKDPVAQCGVTFTASNGLSLDLWGSGRTRNTAENKFGNEIDITIAWSGAVGAYKVYVAGAHYNLHEVRRMNSSDVWSAIIDLSLKDPYKVGRDSTINPFVRLERVDSAGLNVHGTQAFLGLHNDIGFENGWSITQSARVGHQFAFPGLKSGMNGRYVAKLTKKVDRNLSLSAGYRFDSPFGRDDKLKDQSTFFLSGSYSF